MSYQKKSNILLELEQAIKRKVTQKSKTKDQMSKMLQTSVEKRKKQRQRQRQITTSSKPSMKEARISSIQRINGEHPSATKIDQLDNKPLSLFNNENLYGIDSKESKTKKFNNRKLDKLISLIHYVISSSEKAVKYLNSTNFQAQFAVKLYKSDKQNLLNQLKNLTIDDIIESQRSDKGSIIKFDQSSSSYAMLVEENTKLKKDIVIMEKEAERFHRTMGNNFYQQSPAANIYQNTGTNFYQHSILTESNNDYSHHLIQKQLSKFKDCMKRLLSFEHYQQVNELLQKQCRFQIMSSKCTQNSKKIAQIESVMSSLESDKNQLIQLVKASLKGESKSNTQRESLKIKEIQQEKTNLQKQLKQMKLKINQIGESAKLISQNEQLKKNYDVLYGGLSSLVRSIQSQWLYPQRKLSPTKSNPSQTLIEYIKNCIVQKNRECIEEKEKNNYLTLDFEMIKNKNNQQIQFLTINLKSKENQIKKVMLQLEQSQNLNFDLEEKLTKLRNQMQNAQQSKQLQQQNKIISEQQLTIYSLKHSLEKLEEKHNFNESQYNQSREEQEELIKQLRQEMKNREELLNALKAKGKDDQSSELLKLQEELASSKQARLELENQVQNLLKIEEKLQLLMDENKRMIEVEEENQKLYDQLQKISHQKMIMIEKHEQELKLINSSESEFKNIVVQYKDEIASLKDRLNELNEDHKQEANIKSIESENKDKRIHELKIENTNLKNLNDAQDKQHQNAIQQFIRMSQIRENQLKSKLNLELELEIQRKNHQSNEEISKIKKQYEAKIKNLGQSYQTSLQQHKSANKQQMQKQNSKIKRYQTLVNDNMKEIGLLRESVFTLEEKKQQLQKSLEQSKRILEQEVSMFKMKRKHYCNLVKQILKGYADSDDFSSITDLQELLEFGTRKVLQIRKRQRDDESNQRKNVKRQTRELEQQNTEVGDFNLEQNISSLSQIKLKLFTDSPGSGDQIFSMPKIQPLKEKTQSQEQMFEELKKIDQLQSQPENNIDDFQNISQNKMSQSMVSDKQSENKVKQANQFDQFNEQQPQNVNDSLISEQKNQKELQDAKQLDEFNQYKQQNMNSSMFSEQQKPEAGTQFQQFTEYQQNKINDSLMSEDNAQPEDNPHPEEKSSQKPVSEEKMADPQQQQRDFQQFAEYKSDQMNSSLISSSSKAEKESSQTQKIQANISQFEQYKPDQMNSSLNSQVLSKQESKGNELDDFAQFQSNKMNDSVLSESNSDILKELGQQSPQNDKQ